ncbi:MAG: DEAD/DEAH box helicase, partial [Myxococcota bacterium]
MGDRKVNQDGSYGEWLGALLGPLDFAHSVGLPQIDRLRDLDSQVEGASRSLSQCALPPDVRQIFEGLATLFAQPSSGQVRLDRVAEALVRLAPLREPGWAAGLLARRTSVLSGVGPKREQQLAARGLRSVGDLLFHLPSRYEDRRRLSSLDELEVGHRATFVADVLLVDFISRPGRRGSGRILQAVVGDDKGTLNLKWFRGGESIARHLHKGDRLLVSGDIKRYRFSKEIVHPEIEHLQDSQGEGGDGEAVAGQVVPIYTAPEGINPRTLRRLVESAVDQYADGVEGYLPEACVAQRGLSNPSEALRALHRPPRDAEVDSYAARTSRAHERLVLEELFLLEVGLALRRYQEALQPGIALAATEARVEGAIAALPFVLTPAQERVWKQIAADLERPHPMRRLLQGDVGSGKTVVAWLAAVAAAGSGFQTALMAPTELLAEQHMRTLSSLGERADPTGVL